MALFFFLHYLGNRLPYETARQRYAAELTADRQDVDSRYFAGKKQLFAFEFCQISKMVLAGAHRDAADRPWVDAVLPETFYGEADHCLTLQTVSDGTKLPKTIEKIRYWWGHKALLAIALHWLSLFEVHRIILYASFTAWLLLAGAAALLGRRALAVMMPTVVFGMGFSGIVYFADTVNGIQYLATVLAAAGLALLLRRPASARWAPLYCFGFGLISAFLWASDGHHGLVVALIGLTAKLGCERLQASEATRRAAGWIALYLAGFVACFALMLTAKTAVLQYIGEDNSGYERMDDTFTRASHLLERMKGETLAGFSEEEEAGVEGCPGCGEQTEPNWQLLPLVRDIRGFWVMGPLTKPTHKLLSVFSLLAAGIAAAAAAWQVLRARELKAAWSILWPAALMLPVSVQFLLPSDIGFRNARYVFLLLAACWTCLLLAARQWSRKVCAAAVGCLLGGLLLGIASLYFVEMRRIQRVTASSRPAVRAADAFDVYLDEDANRLLYVKNQCSAADTGPRFFVHLWPKDPADLPAHRQYTSFDALDFYFDEYGFRYGSLCAAPLALPDYPIEHIQTGQFYRLSGWGTGAPRRQIWSEGWQPDAVSPPPRGE